MSALLSAGALLCTAAAIGCGLLALAVTRDVRIALAVLLDLLLAAGLLRLAGAPGAQQLLSTAAIVLVRRIVALGLREGRPHAGAKTTAGRA